MQAARGAGMHGRRLDGFTLLELMVTLAVAAILVTIAIPSYRGLVQRNALTASVNDLVGDLNYARSEAVTRGQSVYLCQSSDQASCTGDSDWGKGWIVYAPDPNAAKPTPSDDKVLRVRSGLDGGIKISGDGHTGDGTYFYATGFAGTNNGTFTVCGDDTSSANKEIIIAKSGRIHTEESTESCS